MSQDSGTNGLGTGKFIFDIVKFVLPTALAVAMAYGSVKFTNGAAEQRVTNVETRTVDLQKQLDYFRDHYPPREELKPQLDQMTRTLERIEGNVNALRVR